MTRHLVYRNDATVAVLLWMTRVHDFAGSWALVSHKKLHIWAWPLIPIQPWHMGGFNQPHIHHASWHLQAGPWVRILSSIADNLTSLGQLGKCYKVSVVTLNLDWWKLKSCHMQLHLVPLPMLGNALHSRSRLGKSPATHAITAAYWVVSLHDSTLSAHIRWCRLWAMMMKILQSDYLCTGWQILTTYVTCNKKVKSNIKIKAAILRKNKSKKYCKSKNGSKDTSSWHVQSNRHSMSMRQC